MPKNFIMSLPLSTLRYLSLILLLLAISGCVFGLLAVFYWSSWVALAVADVILIPLCLIAACLGTIVGLLGDVKLLEGRYDDIGSGILWTILFLLLFPFIFTYPGIVLGHAFSIIMCLAVPLVILMLFYLFFMYLLIQDNLCWNSDFCYNKLGDIEKIWSKITGLQYHPIGSYRLKSSHPSGPALIESKMKNYGAQIRLGEDCYAVSIIHYKSEKSYGSADPYILVEGVKDGELFVRLYSIDFNEEKQSDGAATCYRVLEVKEFCNNGHQYPYPRGGEEQHKNFYKEEGESFFRTVGYAVSRKAAERMIKAIHEDKKKVEEGKSVFFNGLSEKDNEEPLSCLFSDMANIVGSPIGWYMDKLESIGLVKCQSPFSVAAV